MIRTITNKIFCTVIGNATERRKIERGREETNEEGLYTVHTYLSTSRYTPGAPTTMPVLPSVVSWGSMKETMNCDHHRLSDYVYKNYNEEDEEQFRFL